VAAPALDMFFAARNQLTGTIPAEWGSVPRRLGGFDVSYNNLTGVLPDAWDLPKLILLDASSNQLEGARGPLIGHWSGPLVGHWIVRAAPALALDLAPALALDLAPALSLDLAPALARPPRPPTPLPPLPATPAGTLPPALGALPELVFLDVRKNQLSGTLEDFANTVAAKSTRLLRINLNGNKFTGPVPPAFARAPIFLNSTDPVMARCAPARAARSWGEAAGAEPAPHRASWRGRRAPACARGSSNPPPPPAPRAPTHHQDAPAARAQPGQQLAVRALPAVGAQRHPEADGRLPLCHLL
jgi:hypothetical protein